MECKSAGDVPTVKESCTASCTAQLGPDVCAFDPCACTKAGDTCGSAFPESCNYEKDAQYTCSDNKVLPAKKAPCPTANVCLVTATGSACTPPECICKDDASHCGSTFAAPCNLESNTLYKCTNGALPMILKDCGTGTCSANVVAGTAAFEALADDRCIDQCACKEANVPVSILLYCTHTLLLKTAIRTTANRHCCVLRYVLRHLTPLAVTATSLCWPAVTLEMFPLSRRTVLCPAPHKLAQMFVRSTLVTAPRLATSAADPSQLPANWKRRRFTLALETRCFPKRRVPVPKRRLVLRLHRDRLVPPLTVFARTTAPIVVLRLLLFVISRITPCTSVSKDSSRQRSRTVALGLARRMWSNSRQSSEQRRLISASTNARAKKPAFQ